MSRIDQRGQLPTVLGLLAGAAMILSGALVKGWRWVRLVDDAHNYDDTEETP